MYLLCMLSCWELPHVPIIVLPTQCHCRPLQCNPTNWQRRWNGGDHRHRTTSSRGFSSFTIWTKAMQESYEDWQKEVMQPLQLCTSSSSIQTSRKTTEAKRIFKEQMKKKMKQRGMNCRSCLPRMTSVLHSHSACLS